MPSYVRFVETELDFDDQHVKIVLKPLTFEDMVVMQDSETESKVLITYSKMMPRYVVSMTPVLDAAGSPVPIEDIVTVTFFAKIVAHAMRAHVEAARPADPISPGDQSGG